METSAEIFVVAGTLAVLFGLLLGAPMARARMASPEAPRHLVTTHLEAIISGAALLGLSVAAGYSTLDGWAEPAAAWLLVVGVAGSLTGGTLNWLMGAEDSFADRSPGFLLQAASGPLMVLGGLVIAVGVLQALFD